LAFDRVPAGDHLGVIRTAGSSIFTEKIMVTASGAVITATPEQHPRQLEEVIVTAQKKEESLQSLPASVSVLNASSIDAFRLWAAKDLAGIVPNLYAGNPGDGRNVMSVRGITSTSYDPSVATYVDGVSQFSLDTYIPQLFDVERIEILRGPQGTLYGR